MRLVVDNTAPPPGLLCARGERRDDCIHMAECLGLLLKAVPMAQDASCVVDCNSYTPEPSHVRLALATRGTSAMGRAVEEAPGNVGVKRGVIAKGARKRRPSKLRDG